MITLFSNDKTNQYMFANYCKSNKKDFMIIQSLIDVIEFAEKIKKGFIILDFDNVFEKDMLLSLRAKSNFFKRAVIIEKEGPIKSLNEALAVVNYEESNSQLFIGDDSLEVATDKILKSYGFSNIYEGYKYLKGVCKSQIINSEAKFNYKKQICNVSKIYNVGNFKKVEKNIRYIIQINQNEDLCKIKGEKSGVKVKNVIRYLLDKIIDELDIKCNIYL